MEKGTGIRKHLPVILIVLMFFIGAGIFLYPNFSNWYYEKHQGEIIQEYGEVIEEISPEELEAEKEAVREFNRSLLENQVVLTDPFDASQLDKNLGDYNEYLAQDEVMAYIDIPKIDVYLPIYHGTDKDTLEKGIGHLANTSFPMGEREPIASCPVIPDFQRHCYSRIWIKCKKKINFIYTYWTRCLHMRRIWFLLWNRMISVT